MQFWKNKTFSKYFFYFFNIALFAALVIYSVKYYDEIIYTLYNSKLNVMSLGLLVLIFCLFLIAYRWFILMKSLNPDIKFKNFFVIFVVSNIYKYIPPKGFNFVMKYKYCEDYYKKLDGKVSTMFCEAFCDLYTVVFFFLALIIFFIDFNKWGTYLGAGIILLLTLFLIYPEVFRFVKIRVIQKLLNSFEEIRQNKLFLYSFLISFLAIFLYGIAFYLVILSFGLKIGFFNALFVFYASQFFGFLLFAPAGIGIRDVSIVGILSLFSVDSGMAISVALSHRLLLLFSELLFGLPLMPFVKKLKP